MSLSSGCRRLLGDRGSQRSCKGEYNQKKRVAGWRCEVKVDDEKVCRTDRSVGGPVEAARRAMLKCETTKSIDVRARRDFLLLSRQIVRLNTKAREGVARISSKFVKLDARAREDVEKLDTRARKKMMRLRHIAMGLSESASMELSTAAEEHWSDGALDADLRLADLRARRRAMEDLYVALQAVKNVHTALTSTLRIRNCCMSNKLDDRNEESQGLKSYPRSGDPSPDRSTAIEDACFKMVAALAEAEGMECTDPDELEFIVAALLDMEEVDGGGGALLVTESASSPDAATRLALADALADAPSLWALGNAGMGALQRLSEDSNPEVAAAATKATNDLKLQWSQQDEFIFPFNHKDGEIK